MVAAALDVLYQRLEKVPVPESAEAEALETDRPGPLPRTGGLPASVGSPDGGGGRDEEEGRSDG